MNNLVGRMRGWRAAQEKIDAQLLAAVPTHPAMVKSALVFAGLLMGVFALSHALFLPAAIKVPLTVVAGLSCVLLLFTRFALIRGLLPYRHIAIGLFFIAAVVWLNATLRLWLGGEPMQATNLGIVLIAAGILMLHLEQYAIICASSLASWLLALAALSSAEDGALWLHYSIFMVEALTISMLAFYWRRKAILRQAGSDQERKRARASEHLSLLAAQSKAIEAERNLRRALEADAAKSMFLANMSHELRTPLNSVVGFAQLLRDREEFASRPELVREYADCIQTSGLHLLGLINQILDLSRANAGGIKLNETSVDLGETVQEITRLLAPQATGSNVGLQAHIGPGMFVMRGDDLRIRQIVTNLVANAVKFTPAGGRVEVTGGVEPESFFFAVRDTGVGIATQDQARIFDPFVQADSGLNKRHQGTGLGLAITRKLVELHGGTITLKSSVGEGSVFTVRFPIERLERDRQLLMA